MFLVFTAVPKEVPCTLIAVMEAVVVVVSGTTTINETDQEALALVVLIKKIDRIKI